MRIAGRHCRMLLVLALLAGSSGCAMFEFMSPANTWRLNRGPALDVGDAYFSVSDPSATAPESE